MAELSFDNILGEQEIETLFTDPEPSDTEDTKDNEETKGTTESSSNEESDNKNNTTEVVNPDELFTDETAEKEEKQPESVGSGKQEGKEKEDTAADDGTGTSLNNQNFYSSIANAMAVDGIFPNLSDDTIKKADSAEGLSDLIEAEVTARLNDKQQRVAKALDNGVEPDDIRKYENTLDYISSITEAQIMEEGDKGEQLRRNLIYQDFLNKGYSAEKARKFTERTIDAGTDIEDAKEALQGNKEFFQNAYNNLLSQAQHEADAEREERAKQAEAMKTSIMKDKLMGDLDISNDVRKRALETITKPVYRDPETGDYLTALQKYETEHRADFLKYIGLVFTITNGFKDFDTFTKGKVKKEVRKGLRELEHTLNNTNRTSDGNLKMVTNIKEDPDSYLGKGVRLDI